MNKVSPAMGIAFLVASVLAASTIPLWFQRRAKWLRFPFIIAPWLIFAATFPELYGGHTPDLVMLTCWVLMGAHIAFSIFTPKYFSLSGGIWASLVGRDSATGAHPYGMDESEVERLKKFIAACQEDDRRREEKRIARGRAKK